MVSGRAIRPRLVELLPQREAGHVDAVEHVADVVQDTGGHLAHAGRPRRAHQLSLQRGELGLGALAVLDLAAQPVVDLLDLRLRQLQIGQDGLLLADAVLPALDEAVDGGAEPGDVERIRAAVTGELRQLERPAQVASSGRLDGGEEM
jgi:hypothetical protein